MQPSESWLRFRYSPFSWADDAEREDALMEAALFWPHFDFTVTCSTAYFFDGCSHGFLVRGLVIVRSGAHDVAFAPLRLKGTPCWLLWLACFHIAG